MQSVSSYAPEQELIQRASGRDEDAFDLLMTPYEQRIWATCLRMMGNEQDAADMLQEAMLRIWRSLGSFAGQSSFATWMYRVTTNVCLDGLRKRKTGREYSLNALSESAGFDPRDPEPGPEERAEQTARAEAIERALDVLSPELRAAFVLRDLQGETYDAVAQALGVSLGTAKSRIHRARLQLAKQLRGHAELFMAANVQISKEGK